MHQSGDDPLQQLPLAEDDLRLVAHALRHVVRTVDRLAGADDADEEEGAPGEEAAGDGDERGQAERARQDVYAPRAFLSSAEIAGTISCRSPITA
jgi:hypothetical protein